MPRVKVSDISIYYEEHGQGDALVCIDGWASTWRNFRWSIPEWSQHFRVVVQDYRGVGQTDAPDMPYTIRMMADDIVGLMDALGIRQAHVLGQSTGSLMAQEMALNHPERVISLVLAGACAKHDAYSHDWNVMRQILRQKLTMEEFYWLSSLTGYVDIDYYNQHSEELRVLHADRIKAGHAPGLDRVLDAANQHDTRDRLPSLKVPTLVVIGAEDRTNAIAMAREVHALIPGSEFTLIEGGAHTAYTLPAYTERILEFLLRHKGP